MRYNSAIICRDGEMADAHGLGPCLSKTEVEVQVLFSAPELSRLKLLDTVQIWSPRNSKKVDNSTSDFLEIEKELFPFRYLNLLLQSVNFLNLRRRR